VQALEDFPRSGASTIAAAIDAAGVATVAWVQSPNDTTAQRIFAVRQLPGGDWSSPPTALDSSFVGIQGVQGASLALAGAEPVVAWSVTDATSGAVRAANFTGGAWSSPQTLASAPLVGTPLVAAGADGTAVVVWTQPVGVGVRHLFASVRRPGAAWTGAAAIQPVSGAVDDSPAAAVDDAGNIVVLWRRSLVGGGLRIHAARYVAGGWVPDQTIDSTAGASFEPQVVALGINQFLAAWLQVEPARFGIRSTRFTGAAWLANPVQVFLDASGDASNLRLSRLGGNGVVAVWKQTTAALNATSTVRASRYSTGNNLWSVSVELGPTGQPPGSDPIALAGDASGRVAAAWVQAAGQAAPAVYSVFTPAAASWSSPSVLDSSPTALINGTVLAASDGGSLLAVYNRAQTTSGSIVRKLSARAYRP
jgi:hypothetical protein